MCYSKLIKRKKKKDNDKKKKKEKETDANRNVNIPIDNPPSSENTTNKIVEQKLDNENQSAQENQNNKDDEIIVEKDASPTTSSSTLSQPQNIPTSTPPIILTTTEMTEKEVNLEITPSNTFDILDNQESDADNSRSIIGIGKISTNISQTSAKMVGSKAALKIFTTSLVAAKPFFPWIEAVSGIINEIVNQYETVEYNKKTCLVLVERVEMINLSVKTLTRRREENFEKFQNENYYHSFIRLHKVLKLVKDFVDDISELKGYRKFILASDVREKANHLLNKLEACCSDLQFAIIISQEIKKKEQQSLDEDVANMTKFLESIETGVTIVHAEGEKTSKVVNRIYEEVSVIHQLLTDLYDGNPRYSSNTTIFNAPTINPKDLYDAGTQSNGSNVIIKKLLRNAIPVACKIVNIPDNNSTDAKRIQAHLSILNSIQSSNKIIKFHGKSEIGDNTVIVFDWAEHGNLKDLYTKEPLNWVQKLRIVHDIAAGLVFLQACFILHKDIRCENILITGDARYEAKIANFDESREEHDKSNQIKSYNTIIRWLAPEKMPRDQKPSKEKYTFKCDIFSFGMLLWELGAQKLPYKEMEMNDIILHVMSKKRENLDFYTSNNGLEPRNDKEPIAKGFVRVIESAWAHERSQRPTITDIYQELDGLVGSHSPRMRPNRSSGDISSINISENSNNNNSTTTPSNDEYEDDSFDHMKALELISPLEEGIMAHKNGRRDEAWKCFEIHATLGDPIAIYWKAYYYLKGYAVSVNANEAIKYFKQAADANVPEAQYYYANALEKAKKPGFIEYFIKAADNDNVMAQRELGRIYYYGNGVERNEEKGIQYLKQAALKNHRGAIEDLKKIDPNLIDC